MLRTTIALYHDVFCLNTHEGEQGADLRFGQANMEQTQSWSCGD
ncbi:hypothetical protein [Pleionea sp. CnH1-48]|nr:hypothetical protein [Pleionea sp. CnH1-48]